MSPTEFAQYFAKTNQNLERTKSSRSKAKGAGGNYSAEIEAIAAEVPEYPAEIQELARGLENDPLQIFNYVKTRIDYQPYFGHRKSALYTLKDKSGNDLDMANLLRDLLGAAGYSSEFVVGWMTMPQAAITNWFGIENYESLADNVMRSMGIPYQWAVDGYFVARYWVKVTVDEREYHLDPAFKQYKNFDFTDLSSHLGYDRADFLAAIQQGATVTPDFVQNLSYQNLKQKLDLYSMNLYSVLKDQYANHSTEELYAGRFISSKEATHLSKGMELSFSPGYEWSEIPDALVSKFRIQANGIDEEFDSPWLFGRSLALVFSGENLTTQLLVNGEVFSSGDDTVAGQSYPITLSMDHPLSAEGGTYTDQEAPWHITSEAETIYGISVTVAPEGKRSEIDEITERMTSRLDAGLSESDKAVMAEAMAIIGKKFARQRYSLTRLISRALGIQMTGHHTFGLIIQTKSLVITWNGLVSSEWPAVGGISNEHWVASGLVAWITGSALEHGILEQMYGAEIQGLSSVKALFLQNQSGGRSYFLHKDNVAGNISNLQNYSNSFLQRLPDAVASSGFALVPANGAIELGQWRGRSWIAYGTADDDYINGYRIGGGLYGGHASEEGFADSGSLQDMQTDNYYSQGGYEYYDDGNPSSQDPVDLATGYFLFEATDLALGPPPPNGVGFSRKYVSGRADRNTGVGHGWTHSLDSGVTVSSTVGPLIGERSVLDTVSTLAYAYVVSDVFADLVDNGFGREGEPYGQDALGQMVRVLGSKWLTDQIVNNWVRVNIGEYSRDFVRMPDGSFNPPPGSDNQLSLVDGQYVLTDGQKTRYVFNAENRISEIIDVHGNTSTYGYTDGLLSNVTDAYGRSLSVTHTDGKITQITDSTGRSVSFAYDVNDNLEYSTNSGGKTRQYLYDANHNLTGIIEPVDGQVVTNTYDDLHRVTRQELPRQTGSAFYDFLYTDYRNVEIDPDGGRTTYFFDYRGRVENIQNALGYSVRNTFDGQDHAVSRTGSDGLTSYTYFENNNIVRTVKPNGEEVVNEYDDQNRLTRVTNELGNWTSYEYDNFGSLIKTSNDLLLDVTATYDARGRLASSTDPRGQMTTYEYDAYGNSSRTIIAGFGDIQYQNDPRGNLLILTDQTGLQSTFEYNDRNRTTRIVDSLGGETINTYDDQDRMIQQIDRRNRSTQYAYTPTGNVEQITFHDGSTIDYVYDKHDALISISNALGATQYEFDAIRRVVKKTDVHGFEIGYEYSSTGKLSAIIYPGDRRVEQHYDENDRLVRVKNWLGKSAEFEYDAVGRLARRTLFNGAFSTYQYDALGRLEHKVDKRSDGSVISEYGFTLDANGNPDQIVVTQPLDHAFQTESESYTYLPDSHRLASDSTDQYVYDNNGRLVEIQGKRTFSYDDKDRLVAIAGDINASFHYDGATKLVRSVVEGQEHRYVYDNLGRLIARANGSNEIEQYYLHGAGLLAVTTSSGDTLNYHYDFNGNTVALSDSGGVAVNAYAYDPFGAPTNMHLGIEQPFTFGGKFGIASYVPEYYHAGARFYSPSTGRFITEDPAGFTGGEVNLYAYANNNPINLTDPSGYSASKQSFWADVAAWAGDFVVAVGVAIVSGGLGLGVSTAMEIGIYFNGGMTAISAGTGAVMEAFGTSDQTFAAAGEVFNTIDNAVTENMDEISSFVQSPSGWVESTAKDVLTEQLRDVPNLPVEEIESAANAAREIQKIVDGASGLGINL